MRPTKLVGLGDDSHDKYHVADGLIAMITKMADGALRKNPWWAQRYVWFDVTAGPAWHPSINTPGTPAIAMTHLTRMRADTHATFVEGYPATCQLLKQYLFQNYGPPTEGFTCVEDGNYRVVQGDSVLIAERLLTQTPKSKLGGIIVDPNGEIDFNLLARLALMPGREGYDLLIYASATTLKRARRAREVANNGGDTRRLNELLASCGKGLWIVRKPSGGPHKWSWLIGTNWTAMPAWAKADFAPVSSELGQQYLAWLTYTEDERQQHMEFDE